MYGHRPSEYGKSLFHETVFDVVETEIESGHQRGEPLALVASISQASKF